MSDYSAIIIGGGLNGMRAAHKLAQSGQSVLVLEQAGQLGGLSLESDLDFGMTPHELNSTENQAITMLNGQGRIHCYMDDCTTDGDGRLIEHSAKILAFEQRLERVSRVWRNVYYSDKPTLKSLNLKDGFALARIALKARLLGKDDMRYLMKIIMASVYDASLRIEDDLCASKYSLFAVLGSMVAPRHAGTMMQLMNRGFKPKIIEQGAWDGYYRKISRHDRITVKLNCQVSAIDVQQQNFSAVTTNLGTFTARQCLSTIGIKGLVRLVGARHWDTELTQKVHHFRARPNLAVCRAKVIKPSRTPGRIIGLTYGTTGLERAFDANLMGQMPPQLPLLVVLHGDSATVKMLYVPSGVDNTLLAGLTQSLNVLKRDLGLELEIDKATIKRENFGNMQNFSQESQHNNNQEMNHWHHGDNALDQSLIVRPTFDFSQYQTAIGGLFVGGAETHPAGDSHGLNGLFAVKRMLVP